VPTFWQSRDQRRDCSAAGYEVPKVKAATDAVQNKHLSEIAIRIPLTSHSRRKNPRVNHRGCVTLSDRNLQQSQARLGLALTVISECASNIKLIRRSHQIGVFHGRQLEIESQCLRYVYRLQMFWLLPVGWDFICTPSSGGCVFIKLGYPGRNPH
jgi:hypothetical protein